nr:response regulator [Blastococcus sp. KM273129]
MERSPVEHLAPWLRDRPFVVDTALAALIGLVTVVLPAGTYWSSQGASFLVGVLLVAPLAWRRRAPVPAAAVVVAAGLLELLVSDQFLAANYAALVMVYSLAAYAPRWAGQAGLAVGLVGAVLASLRYYSSDVVDAVVPAGSIGVAVVAAWALGDLRRARLQRLAALEERAQLLELERDQEMRLAATAERARIAREMHDVVAHSLSVVIAQADGGRYAGRADPRAATDALEAIAATGRQALTDMRALLGVLRDGGSEEYAPQPDVAAIPRPGRGRAGQRPGRRPHRGGDAAADARRPAAGRLPHRAGVAHQRAQARRPGRPRLGAAAVAVRRAGALGARRRPRRRGHGRRLRRPGPGAARHAGARPAARRAPGGRAPRRWRVRGARRPALPFAPMSAIRVLLVDDQQMVRAGFRMVIDSQPDLTVVGEAGDGAAAVEVLARTPADVVLMDIRMPGTDGIEGTRRITALPGPPRVVVLTTFDLDEYVVAAIGAGASGFLLKDAAPEEMLAAIRTVHAGDSVIAASSTRRLLQHVAPILRGGAAVAPAGADDGALAELTPREREVLEQMAYGATNTEIAAHFVVSEATVKTHVGRVLAKTGSRDRVQAVVLAYRTGLVAPADLLRNA